MFAEILRFKYTGKNDTGRRLAHANVLGGSSRVPRGRGMIAWRTPKNVCVGGNNALCKIHKVSNLPSLDVI